MNTLKKRCRVLAISLLLCATATIAFAAGSQDESSTDGEYRIGFAQDTLNQPWRNNQAASVEVALADYGIDAIITDGQGRAEKQISNIEDMIAQGLDLLIVSPAQEGALTPIVERVHADGTPVVLIDRGIAGDGYTTFVHADNYAISEMVADYIAAKLTEKYGEPKGTIVVIEGVPGSTTAVQRDDGFRERIAARYPQMEIIASQPADYRRDLATSVMEDYLQTFDQIDAVFTHADEMTMGAVNAIENAGRRDEILITSVNGTTEAIQAILEGRMDCTPLYTNAAGPGVDLAMKILAGEDVPKHIVLRPLMIDETNAADFFTEGTYSPDPIPLDEQEFIVVEE